MDGIGPPPPGPPGGAGGKPNPHQNRALHVTGIRYGCRYPSHAQACVSFMKRAQGPTRSGSLCVSESHGDESRWRWRRKNAQQQGSGKGGNYHRSSVKKNTHSLTGQTDTALKWESLTLDTGHILQRQRLGSREKG